MNNKVLEICEHALEIAENSLPAQKETIQALVDVICKYNEKIEIHEEGVKALAQNYIDLLKQGHKLPVHKMIHILEAIA